MKRPVSTTSRAVVRSRSTSRLRVQERRLADMEARYTPDYPDVKKMKDTIANLQALKEKQAGNGGDASNADTSDKSDKDKAAAATTASAGKTPPAAKGPDSGKSSDSDNNADVGDVRSGTTPSQLAAMAPVMQVQSQLKSNRMEIQNRESADPLA